MANEVTKTCVIRARVSSKAQEEEGYSLDAQEKFLKEYAEKKHFDVLLGHGILIDRENQSEAGRKR